MINVDGYKAYHGRMKIYPAKYAPFELFGDFLFKPDTGCWYHDGFSYPSEICEIICEGYAI